MKEEEAEIEQIITSPPTIVVFGQTPYARYRIVNELFSKNVLPSLENEDEVGRLRLVRFKHGETPTVSLTLPEDFDLVETLEADCGPWHTVPHKDLLVADTEQSQNVDTALGVAYLEVTQNHPLLRCGTSVVVAPSMPNGLTEEVVRKCVEHTPAILIYGFSCDQLLDRVCIYISFVWLGQ